MSTTFTNGPKTRYIITVTIRPLAELSADKWYSRWFTNHNDLVQPLDERIVVAVDLNDAQLEFFAWNRDLIAKLIARDGVVVRASFEPL